MNTNNIFQQFRVGQKLLAGFLSVCLLLPAAPIAAFADGKGKKDFREGLKYEQQQQWDMAAQKFALAVNAEPNNPEYKIHYYRALQAVAQNLVKRGDTLAEQKDYASAYTAYRTAYGYDPGNDIAKMKMERMLEIQKAEMQGVEQVNYNARTGIVKPVGNEISIASRPRSKGDVVQDVRFKDAEFKTVANTLAKSLGLNVVFDDQVKSGDKVTVELTDITMAKALDIILMQKKYTFEQVDRRTIFIYPDNTTNRPRFEKMLVKTFYLGNIGAQQARTVLTGMLPPGRQIVNFENGASGGAGGSSNSNILLVKATPSELQLVQDILNSIDKNKNEVVLDVEIFEVGHDKTLQIGNQLLADKGTTLLGNFLRDKDGNVMVDGNGQPVRDVNGTSASLTNLGGFGLTRRTTNGNNPSVFNQIFPLAGLTATPSIGGLGFLLGLPPTSLSLLQSNGNSKLLYKTQIHVLDGGQNTVKVGKKVPVRLGSTFPGGGFIGGGFNQGGVGGVGGVGGGVGGVGGVGNGFGGFGGFGGGIDSIQYQDVGLVIEAKPIITNEGYVEVQMKFETSDVQAGSDPLNPIFTQRSLNTVARIQDGVTSIVAGVNQETKGDSRSGLPVVGMLPLIGRLFTAPRQTSSQNDIVITVTPHIVRSAGINKDDFLAREAGAIQGGMSQSVETVVNRAQAEEEEERRIIANQQGVPLDQQPGVAPQTTIPATNQQRANSAPAPRVQPVNNPGKRSINDNNLIAPPTSSAPSNPVVSVPSIPDQPQGDPQAEVGQQPQGKEGETPDLSQYMQQPAQPVAPASVVAASRPENVERAIAKMMAEERARKAAETNVKKAGPQPEPEFPKEFMPTPGPNQKVAPAAPKMAPSAPAAAKSAPAGAGMMFTLSSKNSRQQLGKVFSMTVEVNGQSQMSGATVALKFDEKKLRVKSVKDAGMFGAQPDLGYDINGGNLVVRIKNPNGSAARAVGHLLTIEFEPLSVGEAEISFNNNDTKARIGSALTAASGNSTKIVIGRESAASEAK